MTLELVLILPIILLLAAIIYQVSVMLMTYQAIQGASYVAVKVAARSEKESWSEVKKEVKNAVKTAVGGWYFASLFTLEGDGDGKVEILYKNNEDEWVKIINEESWKEVGHGDLIAVQVKLENLAGNSKTKHYWLLPQFKGVNKDNATLTVNSICVRK